MTGPFFVSFRLAGLMRAVANRPAVIMAATGLLCMTIGRLLVNNARTVNAWLLIVIASAVGDRCVWAVGLRVMCLGLIIGPRLDVMGARLDVVSPGLHILRARL